MSRARAPGRDSGGNVPGGPVLNRGRSFQPLLSAFAILEEADIVTRVPADQREKLECVDLESRLGGHDREPEIPGSPKFRGIVWQAIDARQRSLGLGSGSIHQDEVGLALVEQPDNFRDLLPGVLIRDLAGDDEQDQVPFRKIFNCPCHDDLFRKCCN